MFRKKVKDFFLHINNGSKKILKNKEMLQRRRKKQKNVSMLVKDTESFLWKMDLVKKIKARNVNMHTIYIISFLKKKTVNGVNMHMKNIETFKKK